MQKQGVPAFDQVEGHRPAHDSESDKSDRCHRFLPRGLRPSDSLTRSRARSRQSNWFLKWLLASYVRVAPRHPAQTGFGGGGGLVFAADPPGISDPIHEVEQEIVIDLAGPWFVTTGVV